MVKHLLCCNKKETAQFKPKYINLSSYINQSSSKKRDRIVKSTLRKVVQKMDDKKLFSIFQNSRNLMSEFFKRNQTILSRFLCSQLSNTSTVNILKNTLIPLEFQNELLIKEELINKQRLMNATMYQSLLYFKENAITIPFQCGNICSWRMFRNVYNCKIISINNVLKVTFSKKDEVWEKMFSSIVNIDPHQSLFRNVCGLVITYVDLINMKYMFEMLKMFTTLPLDLCRIIYDYVLTKHKRPNHVF